MSTARFVLNSASYDMTVRVNCTMREDNGYPNQGDLRQAIASLIDALESWDFVEVKIESVRRDAECPS